MTRRTAWTAAFLTVTGAAVGMELYAAWDGSEDTDPWTYLIVDHLPAGLTFAAIAALVAWLGPHFATAYRHRRGVEMTEVLPAPPPTAADARNRALRTFMQGMLAAVAAAIVPVLLAAGGQIRWTKEWWLALAAAVGFAALTAALSYVTRYTHPPNP